MSGAVILVRPGEPVRVGLVKQRAEDLPIGSVPRRAEVHRLMGGSYLLRDACKHQNARLFCVER